MNTEQTMQDELGPWIEHDGGPCPIPNAKAGEWWLRWKSGGEELAENDASYMDWSDRGEFAAGDITHYRLRKTVPDTSVDFPGVGTIPAWPSEPADAEIVGMIRKACKELTGKNATFADDDLRAIVERAELLRDAVKIIIACRNWNYVTDDIDSWQTAVDGLLERTRKAGVL